MTKYLPTLIPFLGDGAGVSWEPGVPDGPPTTLTVIYIAEFPRGVDGTCAYCHGDPGAERSPETSLIAQFYARNGSWAETCPCCDGRPT